MGQIRQLPTPPFFSYETLQPFRCVLYLLYHFGESEEELSCEDPLEELELDEKELPAVEEAEMTEFGLPLLLLTSSFLWGVRNFAFLNLVLFLSGCSWQDPFAREGACLSGNPPFLEFLLDKSVFPGCSSGRPSSRILKGRLFFSPWILCTVLHRIKLYPLLFLSIVMNDIYFIVFVLHYWGRYGFCWASEIPVSNTSCCHFVEGWKRTKWPGDIYYTKEGWGLM